MSRPGDLSDRDVLILRSISRAENVEALGKLTKLPPETLGREIATLQMKGYIADDGTLTQKGLAAAKQSF